MGGDAADAEYRRRRHGRFRPCRPYVLGQLGQDRQCLGLLCNLYLELGRPRCGPGSVWLLNSRESSRGLGISVDDFVVVALFFDSPPGGGKGGKLAFHPVYYVLSHLFFRINSHICRCVHCIPSSHPPKL